MAGRPTKKLGGRSDDDAANDTLEEFPTDAEQPVADAQAEPIHEPVYQWKIPYDADPTYGREVVQKATSVIEARANAIALTPDLTLAQTAWIMAYEPMVVRDTTTVTTEHDSLLYHNALLRRENDAIHATKALFADEGIDPDNPKVWVKGKMADAQRLVEVATDRHDKDCRMIIDAIDRSRAALTAAVNVVPRFAPKFEAPPEIPNASALTVYAVDIAEAKRIHEPHIPGANFVSIDPAEDITPLEEIGFGLLLAEEGLIRAAIRYDNKYQNQQIREALWAVLGRLRSQYGK